jgi:hypothetical protein
MDLSIYNSKSYEMRILTVCEAITVKIEIFVANVQVKQFVRALFLPPSSPVSNLDLSVLSNTETGQFFLL